MTRSTTFIAVLAAACGAACSPALDWREFVPEGTDIRVAFPCRPDRQVRAVVLAGAKVQMQMLACGAGDSTFALAFVDVADPVHVGATLTELRATAATNLRAAVPSVAPLQISGMTPNAGAARLTLIGTLPDGAAVGAHAAFFARGLRVYQATVVGARPAPGLADAFIGALKFRE